MVGPLAGIRQGDVCWADLGEPPGSTAGFRRPVIIIQGDAINRSRIGTALCVPLTSNLKWAQAPGNVLIKAPASGLDRDSVAQVALVLAIDRECLATALGRISDRLLQRIFSGLDLTLGRN